MCLPVSCKNNTGNITGISSLQQNLTISLDYLNNATDDSLLRQKINQAKTLLNGDAFTDTFITKLLKIEEEIIELLEIKNESGGYDLAESIITLFGKQVVEASRRLSPVSQNRYYAEAMDNLGTIYYMQPRFDSATVYYKASFELRKKILNANDADYGVSLAHSFYLYNVDTIENARRSFEKAVNIIRMSSEPQNPAFAHILTMLADLYKSKRQFDTATKLYDEYLSFKKKILGEDNPYYALFVKHCAYMYQLMFQPAKAESLYRHALELTEKTSGKETEQYALCLTWMGYFYCTTGQYQKALPYCEEAYKTDNAIADKHTNSSELIMHHLAANYEKLGMFEKALPLQQQALEIYKGKEKKKPGIYLMVQLANTNEDLGQYDESIDLLEEAMQESLKFLPEWDVFYCKALSSIARVYEKKSDLNEAIKYLNKVTEIRKNFYGENHPDYAASLNDLARIYKKMGNSAKALSLCLQAMQIRKNILNENHPDYVSSLCDLADIYASLGKYDSSKILLQEALNKRKLLLGIQHPLYAETLQSLALAEWKTSDIKAAGTKLCEANNLKLAYLIRTNSTLSEHEKISRMELEAPGFYLLPSMLYSNKKNQYEMLRQVYSNQLSLKSLVLEDQQTIRLRILKSRDSNAVQLYDEWRMNKVTIGKQLLLPVLERMPGFETLLNTTNETEQKLSRLSSSFRSQAQSSSMSTKEISLKLRKNEAAIEFMRFQLFRDHWTDSMIYAAMILRPGNNEPVFVPLFEEKQLQNFLTQHDSKILYQHTVFAGEHTFTTDDSLYRLIWKPLEKYLKNVSSIYYAPAGLLNRISFPAIQSGKQCILEKYSLHELFSTRSLLSPDKKKENPLTAAIWGDIDYNNSKAEQGKSETVTATKGVDNISSAFDFYTPDTRGLRDKKWPALPATKNEMESIRNFCRLDGIDVKEKSGFSATEEAFKAMDGNSPELLHIATHGFFLPMQQNKFSGGSNTQNSFTVQQNPMFRSGLILAGGNNAWLNRPGKNNEEDGILTAYEIAQMDLSKTDLVVLSACETGLGDISGSEGVIGLQRAFKIAGVKQLMLSLWKVPDEETSELMELFYKKWLSGMSASEALRKTQLVMKQKYDPYYWAAFILVE